MVATPYEETVHYYKMFISCDASYRSHSDIYGTHVYMLHTHEPSVIHIRSMYCMLLICAPYMCSLNVILKCDPYMCSLYVLLICAPYM